MDTISHGIAGSVFARSFSDRPGARAAFLLGAIGAMVPDLVSWEWSVSERKGRARLDYTQNTFIKTLVAPYAVRPAAGAPVSAPIAWADLDDPTLRPNSFTIRNEVDRVANLGDLFAGAQTDAQELPKL